jgi:hypothetical protein
VERDGEFMAEASLHPIAQFIENHGGDSRRLEAHRSVANVNALRFAAREVGGNDSMAFFPSLSRCCMTNPWRKLLTLS